MTTLSPPAGTDYFAQAYALIGEPLNLLDAGQQWFRKVYRDDVATHEGTALVLGAVPWMGRLLRAEYQRVVLADASPRMLEQARRQLADEPAGSAHPVEQVQADWLALPDLGGPLGLVVGDNALSFLPFGQPWHELCRDLAQRMRPSGMFMTRMLAVPRQYRRLTVDDIVARYVRRSVINFTEVRALLLLAHWNRATYEIHTEEVLETFERHRATFQPLLQRVPAGCQDDLTTVSKYRGSGAVYFAPPLEEALDVLQATFDVRHMHFGPYALSEFFPLFVAASRNA